MRKLLTASILGLALLLPNVAWGQTGTITGTVTDEQENEPLPGATVQIVDMNLGTATDANGQYRLTDVPAGQQTIRVSFVGFDPVERTVNVQAGGTVRANVQLAQAVAQLQETVVTGYRQDETTTETGAAAGIDAPELEKAEVNSPESALQGTLPGVRVTSTSGQPGSSINVKIRGTGSITAGSDPLFIVDGVQISRDNLFSTASGSPLAGLNPRDIESMQVLRGASAAAIYGSQAANGVVLIETKSGSRNQATRINFGLEVGRVQRLGDINVLNTDQWASYNGTAYANSSNSFFGTNLTPQQGREVAFNPGCPDAVAALCGIPAYRSNFPDLGTDTLQTDWRDAIYRKAYTQSYNMSIRGGDQNTSFYISGNYSFDQGQVIDSQFKGGGITAKVDHEAREWISASAKINVNTQNIRGTIEDGAFINSPFWSAYFAPPNQPVYNVPGDPSSGFNGTPNAVFTFNPVQQEEFNDRSSNNTQVLTNAALNWTFSDSWGGRTFAGLQYQDTKEATYDDPRVPAQAGAGGSQFVARDRLVDYNLSQTLTYDNVFGSLHTVSGLLGTEFKKESEVQVDMTGESFPNALFRTLRTAATPTGVDYALTQYRLFSGFGNVTYNYDNRYQLEASMRVDGSSRFGSENRYGTFGTVAGYWRISEEDFLQDADFLTDLKLRASYGEVGNNDIGNFASRQLYSGEGEYDGSAGIRASQLGNNALTWEEKREYNVGLDISLFNGRISSTVDVYRNNFTSLLLNRDLPLDSGFGEVIDNVGELRNEGIEIRLQTVNLNYSDFQWRTDFNISFQDSEVTDLLPGQPEIDTAPNGVAGVFRENVPPDQFEVVPYAGVNPANGIPMFEDRNGNLTYDPDDTEDLQLVGNTNADFYGGLTNSFSVKGLTAEVFFQYDYGRTTFNNDKYFLESNFFNYVNRSEDVLDYWREPGDITDTPKPLQIPVVGPFITQNFQTGRWMENASYIRLKRVRISYSLPSSVLNQFDQLQSASLYVQGRNLATWTNFTGFDPEVVGTAIGSYPQGKTFTAGLNITL